jgi:site-specific recombinase
MNTVHAYGSGSMRLVTVAHLFAEETVSGIDLGGSDGPKSASHMTSITLSCRSDRRVLRRTRRKLLALFEQLAKLPLEIRQRLLDRSDFPSELIRLEFRFARTSRTSDLCVALCLSHRYREWLAAVRAGDVELLLV